MYTESLGHQLSIRVLDWRMYIGILRALSAQSGLPPIQGFMNGRDERLNLKCFDLVLNNVSLR